MRWKLLTAVFVVIAIVGGGLAMWLKFNSEQLPAGLAMSNGRLEAERIDIASRFPARVLEVLVEEGDMVEAGEVLARLDSSELEDQLREARAVVQQSESQLAQAVAVLAQRKSELLLAEKEFERTSSLATKGFSTTEQVDQRKSATITLQAAVRAAEAGIEQATAGIEAAIARVERLDSSLDDHVLISPRNGRVQYRLAQPGEVLGAGGKVLTLLDLSDVYMTLFLPISVVGQLELGSEARIIADAAPGYVVPATVSFVATEAQFTPKYVETSSEREKLMYRVKVRILPEVLQRYTNRVKAGITGIAYVKISADANWPAHLQIKLPELQGSISD
ncbi:MAG: HlyD family efflux transporter periplasmic adaptor subunit [Granulosicoccus sp.]